jgi:hypothetical protein
VTGRYEQVEVQVGGMWECRDCGALVADRQLHDRTVHAEWRPKPAAVPNQQYDTGQVPPGRYSDPRPEETP